MLLRSVKNEDSLLFKCLAKNDFGSSERLIKLIVLGVPEAPSQLKIRDVWSRSALVTWLAPYSVTGASRVTNFTVQYWRKSSPNSYSNHRREETVVDGLQTSALLVNLLPAVTYELSIVAQNSVGRSEPSEVVNVTTSEEEPSAPPTDVHVEPKGSTTLRVTWKVPPNESINGKLVGFYVGYRPRFSLNQHLSPSALMPLQVGQPVQSAAASAAANQQQSPNQQSVIYSFKTADAVENQQYYDIFLTNLKHGQEYEVTVRAFNKAGSGPDCHSLLARTSSARLPQAPVLQVQSSTANSVTLKWTSTVVLSGSRGVPGGQLDTQRYVLNYQIQGEREWYELTVGNGAGMRRHDEPHDYVGNQLASSKLDGTELITSQASVHTLSNLQPNLVYRIYVAAANDYGLGDPSNVITLKTENSSQAAILAYAGGGAQLDASSVGSLSAFNLLDSLVQQRGIAFSLISTGAVIALLVSVILVYTLWQRRSRSNSSSSSASYPTSWMPAACDTMQSDYSVKRYPTATLEIYDQVAGSRQQPRALTHQQHSGQLAFTTVKQTNPRNQHQQQQLLRGSGSTTMRPVLSSQYHRPADLMPTTNSNTLQLHSQTSSNNRIVSSTLNRHQNRQLPPIPYSTLSVKEIQSGRSGAIGNQQTAPQHQATSATSHRLSTGGSQTPLIYGIIE